MQSNLVEKISNKVAVLPIEMQREAFDFIEFLEQKVQKRPAFQSVEGIWQTDLSNLEEDLKEVRSEMRKNFPRDFSDQAEGK